MIILLFGKDRAIRKRAYEYLKTFGEVDILLHEQEVTNEEVKRLAEGASLFSGKIVVLLENSLTSLTEETLELAKTSENIFFFDEISETKLPELLLSYSEHIFDGLLKKEKEEFPFALCNAIKKKDKKEAWIQFLICKKRGEAELVHGAILWQIRTIHKDIIEGKKHVYGEREIEKLHEELVIMYHDAHNGKISLFGALEMFVMRI